MKDLKSSKGLARFVAAVFVIAVLAMIGEPAVADVTIKQKISTKGMGGLMNAETKLVTSIKGDKKCEDSEMKLTNKMIGFMGGGKPIKTTTIVRLDRDPGVIINVDHQTKSYTEMPVGQLSEMMGADAPPGDWPDEEEEDSDMMFDTSEVTMSPPRIDIKKTGKKEKISGYRCEQTILTMETDGVDKETGEEFTFIVTFDMWLSEDVEGADEYMSFSNKMAEDAGFGTMQMTGEGVLASLAGYGVDPEDLEDKLSELEGFPIRQTMTFTGEGGQFNQMMSAEDQEALDEASKQAAAAMNKFKGLFGGGKKDKDEEEAEDNKDSKSSSNALMEVTVTVTDISTKGVSDERFEPPSKYEQNK